MDSQEQKHRRTGVVVSLGLHALLLLIFTLLLAWKEPNPPIPEYGIELNFGIDDQGAGNVQPESPITQTESISDAQAQEQPTPDVSAVPEQEVTETEPAEAAEQSAQEAVTTHDSPDARLKETAKEPVNTPKKEEKQSEAKPTQSVADKKPATGETKEPVNNPAPSGGEASDKKVESTGHGDNATAGDKGNEKGTVDSRALYGTPGGGASLDMAGWAWEGVPRPNDTSNESGRIVFEITVDDTGEVIGIKTLERGVSASVEAIYKKEVAKLYFRRNPPDSPAPPRSVGKITFIIKSR